MLVVETYLMSKLLKLDSKSETYDTFGEATEAAKLLRTEDYVVKGSVKVESPDNQTWVVTWEEIPEETTNTEENKPECGGTGNLRSGNGSNTLNQVTNNFNN